MKLRPIWMILLLLPLVGGCALLARGKADSDGAAPVVAAMLKAYGGREALAAVRTVAAQGRIEDEMRKLSGGYSRTMRRPGGLRIEVLPERGGELRILDGERGWQKRGKELVAASNLALVSMRYQYAYLDLPMCLADQSCSAKSGGRVKLGNDDVDLLLVDVPSAPQLRVYVDRDSHLIRRVAAEFTVMTMGSSELATGYDDYQPAQGVLFPRRLTNYSGGEKISVLTLDSLKVNEPLPAETFAPPAATP